MVSTAEKIETIKAIKEELAKGNFEEAANVQKKAGLNSIEFDSITSTFLAELTSKRKFKEAFELATHYDMPSEVINNVVLKNFTALFAKGDYDAAATWGIEHKLEPAEILKASMKLFEKAIHDKDIPKALAIREKYRVPKEMLKAFALQAFNSSFQHKEYYNAALLAKAFDFPLIRILTAAVKAFIIVLNATNTEGIIQIEKEFNILSDVSFDEIQQPEQDKIIELVETKIFKFNSENPEAVIKILGELDLLGKFYRHDSLKGLLKFILTLLCGFHTSFLEQGKAEKAIDIIEHFQLSGDDIPQEIKNNLLQAASKYHDLLLEQYNYSSARKVKDKYAELFKTGIFEDVISSKSATLKFFEQALGKGDLNLAIKAAKEYNIPAAQVKTSAAKAMTKAMDKNNYDEAFAVFKQFQLDGRDENVLSSAKKHFEDALTNNLYELAADLGFFFNLDKDSTKDAAYQAWKRFMKSGKYDKAKALYLRHRLPPRILEATIEEIYQYNIQIGLLTKAQQIRKEYRLKVGIMTLLREFFQKLGFIKPQ